MQKRRRRLESFQTGLIYVSIAGVAVYLARHGLLEVPRVHAPLGLVLSLPFLGAGFALSVLAWRRMLAAARLESSVGECVASMGLSVFAKYLPGKIWLLVGRATFVAQRRAYSLATVTTVSLNDQVLALWSGLAIGGAGLLAADAPPVAAWTVLALWLGLSLLVFTPWAHRFGEALLARVLRRPVDLPALDARRAVRLLPWFLGGWGAWSVGFDLFARALTPEPLPMSTGLAFPLAATLGVLAVLVPGGLGVREGVLAAYLVALGVNAADALTIAVTARLWFLFGEALFFLTGVAGARRLARSDTRAARQS